MPNDGFSESGRNGGAGFEGVRIAGGSGGSFDGNLCSLAGGSSAGFFEGGGVGGASIPYAGFPAGNDLIAGAGPSVVGRNDVVSSGATLSDCSNGQCRPEARTDNRIEQAATALTITNDRNSANLFINSEGRIAVPDDGHLNRLPGQNLNDHLCGNPPSAKVNVFVEPRTASMTGTDYEDNLKGAFAQIKQKYGTENPCKTIGLVDTNNQLSQAIRDMFKPTPEQRPNIQPASTEQQSAGGGGCDAGGCRPEPGSGSVPNRPSLGPAPEQRSNIQPVSTEQQSAGGGGCDAGGCPPGPGSGRVPNRSNLGPADVPGSVPNKPNPGQDKPNPAVPGDRTSEQQPQGRAIERMANAFRSAFPHAFDRDNWTNLWKLLLTPEQIRKLGNPPDPAKLAAVLKELKDNPSQLAQLNNRIASMEARGMTESANICREFVNRLSDEGFIDGYADYVQRRATGQPVSNELEAKYGRIHAGLTDLGISNAASQMWPNANNDTVRQNLADLANIMSRDISANPLNDNEKDRLRTFLETIAGGTAAGTATRLTQQQLNTMVQRINGFLRNQPQQQ